MVLGMGEFVAGRLLNYREIILWDGPLHHTPKRLLNALLARLEMRLGRTRLISRPYRAFIDPSAICMLKCPLCQTGKGVKGGPKKCVMKLEDFRKTIDELGEYLYAVYLYNWGEPFLNKDAFRIIEYAKSKGIDVTVSSNLNAPIEGFGEKVVKSGLDCLYVSLDGIDQKTYEGYRRGGSYALAVSNLASIVEAKKRLGSSHPYIIMSYLVMRHNEHGVAKFKENMVKMGADVVHIANVTLLDYKSDRGFLPLDARYSGYGAGGKRKVPFCGCMFPWTTAFILPDLKVSPCCFMHYFDKKYDAGDLRTQKFSEIWNSPGFLRMRAVIRDRLLRTENPCSKCVAGDHPHETIIEWTETKSLK